MLPMADHQLLLVQCACPSQACAEALARDVLQQRLAGCVQIMPAMTSMYYWEQKLCQETECLQVIKSIAQHWPALEARLRAQHPYEVPEIIAIKAAAVSRPYQRWLQQVLDRRQP